MTSNTPMNMPPEIEGYDELVELALDLRWSWDHKADDIWRPLDPELWDLTRNPWLILQTISRSQLKALTGDATFRERVATLAQAQKQSRQAPAWFQKTHAQPSLNTVAYFSMEFMLGEALPIYSGGLGNVAGDQLKAASDLGVPVVGVSLLYAQGYFRQFISADGAQQALYPYNDPGQLQISPLRDADGEWVRVQFQLPGYSAWVRAWQARVGRATLYLLDTNDPANPPVVRGITSELYGGGPELRLRQEIVLGIGGWRLLNQLGIKPEVCHLNEGHAAFAVLERAAACMRDLNAPFDVALDITRAGNVFTTHTPVAAGFDLFSPQLMNEYLGGYAKTRLGISLDQLMALGRANADDANEPLNMAYLAMRGCGSVNGVSQLHGKVSQRIFQPLFPRWPQDEAPIGAVTNGVHVPTWDSAAADALWTKACGAGGWLGDMRTLEPDLRAVPDAELWQMRSDSRAALVDYVRERYARQVAAVGGSGDEVAQARQIFDPNTLTLGFARRFAAYKRPTLLLHDTERLIRILTNPAHPVQLIVAGKAHPADQQGQAMVREWVQFSRRSEVQGRVVFLSDYDMLLTEHLAGGVDVWINNPRRPWEACGTSGMKVLVNGGLNLSELDGWWVEAYSPQVGWALGDGREHGDDPTWDAAEVDALYQLLEREVAPQFYDRDENGIPQDWLRRVRESMATLTAQFSANRAVREYTEAHYLPAAAEYARRAADGGALGKSINAWKHALAQGWGGLQFGQLKAETRDGQHAFEVRVTTGSIDPDGVRAELFADGVNGGQPVRAPMTRGEVVEGMHVYRASVVADRPASDFTPRITPHFDGVAVPLEIGNILWHH